MEGLTIIILIFMLLGILGYFSIYILQLSFSFSDDVNATANYRVLVAAFVPLIIFVFIRNDSESVRAVVNSLRGLSVHWFLFFFGILPGILVVELTHFTNIIKSVIINSICAFFLSATFFIFVFLATLSAWSVLRLILFPFLISHGLYIVFRGFPNLR